MRMLAPRTVFAISLTLAMAFSAATFATTEAVSGRDLAQSRLCDQAIAEAERAHGIPNGLLRAVSLKETGRWDDATKASFAWPWTVTSGADGKYLPSLGTAIRTVKRMQRDGVTNIDVGCLQINLGYHGQAFEDLEAAFDPRSNADYGASFLRQLKDSHGNWTKAVERYHSSDPERGRKYRERVYALRSQPLAAPTEPTEAWRTHADRQNDLRTAYAAARKARDEELERMRQENEVLAARLRAEFEERKARVLKAWEEKMKLRREQQQAQAG
jgi:hypothetical protein